LLRLAFLLIALAAGVGGLATLGGRPPASTRGRLVIWTSHNNTELAVFSELSEVFEGRFRARRGRPVDVVVQRVPHEGLDTRLKSAALSRSTPDVCRVDVATVAPMAWGRAAVRLDGPGGPTTQLRDLTGLEERLLPAALGSNLIAVPTASGEFETGLYGVPEQTNCLVLFRNRALFRERTTALEDAGLDPEAAPTTWHELARYATALTQPDRGIYGFGMENTLWWSLPFLYSWGGSVLLPDSGDGWRVGLSEEPARAAYGFWTGLAQPRELGDVEGALEGGMWRAGANKDRAFVEGRLGMVLSCPWNVPIYLARFPYVAASLVPAGPAGSASTVGGNNMVMLPTCVDREAAGAFLEFVMSDEYQLRFARELGQVPVTRSALSARRTEADALETAFLDQMPTARARPPIPNFHPLEMVFQGHMELALAGEVSTEEALSRVASDLEREVLGPLRDAR
jgi:ABC-type glycerol-3-phosphate transport system substrate-binding protein